MQSNIIVAFFYVWVATFVQYGYIYYYKKSILMNIFFSGGFNKIPY